MHECLICYEVLPPNAQSMCPFCQQATICAPCQAQWRDTCFRRGRDLTCPKCRQLITPAPARRLAAPITLAAMAAAFDRGPLSIAGSSPLVKAITLSTLLFFFLLPILMLVYILFRMTSSARRRVADLLSTSMLCIVMSFVITHLGTPSSFLRW